MTAALLPAPNQGQRLTRVMGQLLPAAGPHHFLTGSPAALHLTVRALEHRRAHLPPADPAVRRYLRAITRAAQQSPPLRFRVTGLTLTTSSVLATVDPVDGGAERLAALLAKELGADGWREADLKRTIWYSTLLHFAGPITRPADLVAFVAARRQLGMGVIDLDRLSLVSFAYPVEPDGSRYLRVHELGAGSLTGA